MSSCGDYSCCEAKTLLGSRPTLLLFPRKGAERSKLFLISSGREIPNSNSEFPSTSDLMLTPSLSRTQPPNFHADQTHVVIEFFQSRKAPRFAEQFVKQPLSARFGPLPHRGS